MYDLIKTLDPIEEHEGYLVKRGDKFKLGYVNGSKVRQSINIVSENLDLIKEKHGGSLIVSGGLPSAQTSAVAQVAKHFNLECIVCVPRYDNSKVDLNRINISIAQKVGAKIFGVSNPQPSGSKCDVKWHIENSNPYEINFGDIGYLALDPIIYQVQNIPNKVEEITVIAGSGFSALGVLMGVKKYGKSNVKEVNIIDVSGFTEANKSKWYDPLPQDQKFDGEVNLVSSEHPYRKSLKTYPMFDYTYESKAWDWMVKNREPSLNHLFWVVGMKSRDLSLVEPIKWYTSGYQDAINKKKNPQYYF
jgi:1-aminocyclopropane-1-carboxylate deaminase/D-cysteine desulfhydrase-like pyridoxal-dependent ACC family enzyme